MCDRSGKCEHNETIDVAFILVCINQEGLLPCTNTSGGNDDIYDVRFMSVRDYNLFTDVMW